MAPTRLLLFIITLFPSLLSAQPADSIVSPAINAKRLTIFIAGAGTLYSGSLVGLNELWYKNSDQQSFHFFNDNKEWKQVDKVGHFSTAFYCSAVTSRALRWSNVKSSRSDFIGALTGFLIMVPIEIFDGFSAAYGASTGDLLANAGGAAFFYGQSILWKEVRIWPKFSYHNTRYASLRPNVLGDNWSSRILKDYNGQTHWLSIDVDKFVTFPRWLNVAVGYGANQMVYAHDEQNLKNGFKSYRQYYLSLDIDLTAIKTKSKFLKSVIFFANMIKIPTPTIEFSKKGITLHPLHF